jgi:allantoate deiminase
MLHAENVIAWCRRIAECTEDAPRITRTFLSPPMREVHSLLSARMRQLGMQVFIDPAGNIRGLYAGETTDAPRLLIGSHLDTVPNAGMFDGILGVMLGIALVGTLEQRRLPFAIEVIGFSEEEGIRFKTPFIGSRALAGTLDLTPPIEDAIREYGLDPSRIADAKLGGDVLGYIEFHIEQGPVLESLGLPLGVVDAIVGQKRLELTFHGSANHAGTTPMHLRHDALAAAAEWISFVETTARNTPGMVATVGRLEVEPGAINVIPGLVRLALDVRSMDTDIKPFLEAAARRGLRVEHTVILDHPATPLANLFEPAVRAAGYPVHHMNSGAGHDAQILAPLVPSAMLFLRSPGGISHHPDESVLVEDVDAALRTGLAFVETFHA